MTPARLSRRLHGIAEGWMKLQLQLRSLAVFLGPGPLRGLHDALWTGAAEVVDLASRVRVGEVPIVAHREEIAPAPPLPLFAAGPGESEAPPAGPRTGRQDGGGPHEAAAGPGGGTTPPGHSDDEAEVPSPSGFDTWFDRVRAESGYRAGVAAENNHLSRPWALSRFLAGSTVSRAVAEGHGDDAYTPEEWHAVPLEDLGLEVMLADRLEDDAQLVTVGDVAAWLRDGHELADIPGLADGEAGALARALLRFAGGAGEEARAALRLEWLEVDAEAPEPKGKRKRAKGASRGAAGSPGKRTKAKAAAPPAPDDAPFASPGDVIRTSYGTGPYVVESIASHGKRDGRREYSLTLRDAGEAKSRQSSLNDYQRQADGRITAPNGDELVVLPAGSDGGPTWWEWSRFLEARGIALASSRPEYREHQRAWMQDKLVEIGPNTLANPSAMKAWGERLRQKEGGEPEPTDPGPAESEPLDLCSLHGGPPSSEVDIKLRLALDLLPRSTRARWLESGATDATIREQLGTWWGLDGRRNEPVWCHGGYHVRGGTRPAFWSGDLTPTGHDSHKRAVGVARPTLQGPPLLVRVRRLLEIPQPQAVRTGKAVRRAIREVDRVEQAALESTPAEGETHFDVAERAGKVRPRKGA